MAQEISTEVKDVTDVVRDHVRKTIAGAIPEELVDRMVNQEIDRFLSADGPGSLQHMIREEIHRLYSDKVSAVFRDMDWHKQFPNQPPSETATAIIKQAAPSIIEEFSRRLVEETAQNLANSIRY